jgi:hypothetical protein
MNDRDREERLGELLHRRLVAPDAPGRIYDHVGRLGSDDPTNAVDWRFSPRRFSVRPGSGPGSHGTRVLAGLTAAVGVAALLAVGLAWRQSHGTGPLGGASATDTLATTTPSAVASPVASRAGIPWSGPAPQVEVTGRLDSQFGWATTYQPGKLYVTENGGTTWQDRTPANLAGNFEPFTALRQAGPWDVRFADSQHGWVIYARNLGADAKGLGTSEYDIYRTADGGSTWTVSQLPIPPTYGLLAFYVLDDQHVWASVLGYDDVQVTSLPGPTHGQFWGSQDGGATWSMVSSAELGLTFYGAGSAAANPLRPWPNKGRFVSPLEGWAVWDLTTLMHTADGGRSWASSALPLPAGAESTATVQIERFPAASASSLVVSGEYWPSKTSNKMMWVTWTSPDGGAHWAIEATAKLYGLEPFQPSGDPDASTIAFYDRTGSPILIRLFDPVTDTFTASLDGTRPCGPDSGVGRVSLVTASDLWVICDGRSGPYGTVDGGTTWKALMTR